MAEHPIVSLIRPKLADPSRPFTILVSFETLPGRGAEVAAAIVQTDVVRLSRLEAGCLAYDLLQDVESPDRFAAHECWRDLAALAEHLSTPHFAAIGAALAGLAEAPKIRVLRAVGT